MSECLDLLAKCREAANSSRWQSLAKVGGDYMEAFEKLKYDLVHCSQRGEEDWQAMQNLECEQRRLIRLVRQRQEAIQEQLQVLRDAKDRLNRMQDISQGINN
ncbi:MAG TPA: hypothetical protein VJ961_02140 [Mariprofundaceae bacterium]|nr:hypothetical protein [Mariprofundaceae bacterium]